MIDDNIIAPDYYYTPRGGLAALGLKLAELKLLAPIERLVQIKQKTIKYTPFEKLTDAFIAILAGAHGVYEVNTRLRADPTLQKAFGRSACAEQSVIQDTLNAATSKNVAQAYLAMDEILRKHSLSYHHDYQADFLLLDIDITGLPCSANAQESKKGYFSDQGIRYGRQLGRVVAASYQEIIVDRLYPGNIQLVQSLQWLIEATELSLDLTLEKRQRTIIRTDAGGGDFNNVNQLLARGYQIHMKAYSTVQAQSRSSYVERWIDDPKHPDRQMGWGGEETFYDDGWRYCRNVRRLVIRWKKKNHQMHYAMLLSTLEPATIISLLKLPQETINDEAAVILAYAHFYDQRAGSVEIAIKQGKQGVGINKRSKRLFPAQQLLHFLAQLADNVIIWSRNWLAVQEPKLAGFGILRFVRDLFHISGLLEINCNNEISHLYLNIAAPLASNLANAFHSLLKSSRIGVDVAIT
jgi:hypothetical protein